MADISSGRSRRAVKAEPFEADHNEDPPLTARGEGLNSRGPAVSLPSSVPMALRKDGQAVCPSRVSMACRFMFSKNACDPRSGGRL
jgi:hypothetical protein